MERIYRGRLVCLIPIYLENKGDCTEVFLENSPSFIIEKTITSVMNNLLTYYMLDLKELRKIYGDYIQSKNLVPLAFDGENIFIPFKARKPFSHNDKAFGYFNLNYYGSYRLADNFIVINFKDGQSINCLAQEASFKKHLKNGQIIRSSYLRRKMPTSKRENYLLKDQDSLAILLKELGDLKKILNKNRGPI